MQIARNRIAKIDYTLTDDAQNVLDSSNGGEPLSYIHGVGQIIPGLEKALAGKSAGDTVQVAVAPQEGYGERDAELLQVVPRDRFESPERVAVGMQFHAQGAGGPQVVTVVGVDADNVTVDANHPLAGKTLHFDVKVLEVRDATEEELRHGHVHGPDGHDH